MESGVSSSMRSEIILHYNQFRSKTNSVFRWNRAQLRSCTYIITTTTTFWDILAINRCICLWSNSTRKQFDETSNKIHTFVFINSSYYGTDIWGLNGTNQCSQNTMKDFTLDAHLYTSMRLLYLNIYVYYVINNMKSLMRRTWVAHVWDL